MSRMLAALALAGLLGCENGELNCAVGFCLYDYALLDLPLAVPPDDLDRIEVVEGPEGSAYVLLDGLPYRYKEGSYDLFGGEHFWNLDFAPACQVTGLGLRVRDPLPWESFCDLGECRTVDEMIDDGPLGFRWQKQPGEGLFSAPCMSFDEATCALDCGTIH